MNSPTRYIPPCLACADLGFGGDHAEWIHMNRNTPEGLTHAHLAERIRTLNLIEKEHDDALHALHHHTLCNQTKALWTELMNAISLAKNLHGPITQECERDRCGLVSLLEEVDSLDSIEASSLTTLPASQEVDGAPPDDAERPRD